MPYLNASQERYLRIFSNFVNIDTGEPLQEDFAKDIKQIREEGISQEELLDTIKSLSPSTPFASFLVHYGFPYAMAEFLQRYIMSGEVNPFLIHSGIFFVSEADRTATGHNRIKDGYVLYKQMRSHNDSTDMDPELKLVIPAGVKLNEVKEFLDENWRRFVQPRMILYERIGSTPNKRIRQRSLPAVESRICQLKSQHKTAAQIAAILNQEFGTTYTYNNVNQIYYRMKQG